MLTQYYSPQHLEGRGSSVKSKGSDARLGENHHDWEVGARQMQLATLRRCCPVVRCSAMTSRVDKPTSRTPPKIPDEKKKGVMASLPRCSTTSPCWFCSKSLSDLICSTIRLYHQKTGSFGSKFHGECIHIPITSVTSFFTVTCTHCFVGVPGGVKVIDVFRSLLKSFNPTVANHL